ncbi:MAG: IPTL-CTERM sorting domain-containing protein [candidate division Zixibacteria bacterium]|nr:IPTL-CTERM sorting domain-containing protein [candidate division Zixibacteria bacterium]MCI0595529.1 IPTL-CTERM sorting domain-containing protein [candidate division Zixibacteria bacterium]
MLFNKRLLQLVTAGLLFLFPATVLGAALQVVGTASRGAIDTLTVEDGTTFGKVAANVDVIIFNTDSLATAPATRDRIVLLGNSQLDCRFFRIQPLDADRFQINATGGRVIASLKLNGSEITAFGDSTNAGQLIQRNDANQNPSLPACSQVPAVSFYGLIALALALGGFVVWMFRKRKTGPA